MRGRRLYLAIAEASFENAVAHFKDSVALRKRGSRGHACSLAILSIEESARALSYKLAGEGVYRIVAKKPDGLSAYSESQLTDHKFRHGLIARLVYQGIVTSPIQRVLPKGMRGPFSRKQVELLTVKLFHEPEMLQIKLRTGGRAVAAVNRMFEILGHLNEWKNAGLYVGRRGGRISLPNDIPRKTLSEVLELAGVTLEEVGTVFEAKFEPAVRRQAAASVREVAAALRKASKRAPPSGGPPNRSRPLAGSSNRV